MPPREIDEAHDVLAADEFAMPAADPDLHHHGPVSLPDEPFGDDRPHDVLAAEEFPMPAGRPHPVVAERRGGSGRLTAELALALLAVVLVRRRRRRQD